MVHPWSTMLLSVSPQATYNLSLRAFHRNLLNPQTIVTSTWTTVASLGSTILYLYPLYASPPSFFNHFLSVFDPFPIIFSLFFDQLQKSSMSIIFSLFSILFRRISFFFSFFKSFLSKISICRLWKRSKQPPKGLLPWMTHPLEEKYL